MPSYKLTSDQRVQLQSFLERHPNLDETQGYQRAKELGLEPKQIEHHQFQNTEIKAPTLMQTDVINQQGDNINDREEADWMEELSTVACAAMAELMCLIRVHGPLWANSSSGEGHVLVPEIYVNLFPWIRRLSLHDTVEESSKHCITVRIQARQLVEMLLDSEEWVNFFPTIVSTAERVIVLDIGSLDDRHGALQVVYEKLHSFSPLASPRELFFLRYCQKVADNVWAIAHVSIDSFRGHFRSFTARRLPSGFVIHQITEEFCMVTWIEHVLVKEQTNPRDHIHDNTSFGAQRWLWALHRMSERFACISIENMPLPASPEVLNSTNPIYKALRVSNGMVQGFCQVMYSKGFPQTLEAQGNKINVTLRSSTAPDMPQGIIATAVASVSLSVSPHEVLSLLTDPRKRPQWDILSYGFTVNEEQTYNQVENNMMIFQESCADPWGAYVVYAPISMKNACTIMSGEDSTVPKVLPSGFLITGHHRAIAAQSSSRGQPAANNKYSVGTFLTIGYQLLFSCDEESPDDDPKREIAIRILFSILGKIKSSLNISD
ncbi:hypothetical protein Fmac_001565 [Flemingia macrophylla]|uniref:START domain-containing protein n=1 Tax=Flemingia macrophylla TaxID=520843 RepID=A0ABD1NHG1_9FABA